MSEALEQLTDIENCTHLAISAHEAERHDHVIHYLKVIRKHITSLNIDLDGGGEQRGVPEELIGDGNEIQNKKPSLDDYDEHTIYNEQSNVHFAT